MKYAAVKGLDKKVSRMVYGCDWISGKDEELKKIAFETLDNVCSVGCNAVDTAYVYCGGESERVIGQWMEARGNRESLVVLSKGAHHNQDRRRVTPYDILSDIHDSLVRLRTLYIDIYVLHRDNPDVPVGPIVDVLNKLRDEGKIRAFGGSNWTHRRIEEANEYAYKHGLSPFTASSPNFGLADQVENPWGELNVGIGGEPQKEARDWYLAHPDVGIFAYSSLARGFFSGRIKPNTGAEEAQTILDRAAFKAYFHPVNLSKLGRAEELAVKKGLTVPQIAAAYVISHPLNIFSLQSPRGINEMRQNAAAIDTELTSAELSFLERGSF
jgi:aryl-alcohol dehydrogenase-like predicted oxidoreductase